LAAGGWRLAAGGWRLAAGGLSSGAVNDDHFAAAFEALDDADAALRKLDLQCCEPGRSPRMKALGETLAAARAGVDAAQDDGDAIDVTIGHLEDAGAQLGHLQIGCCTEKRMPLYARMLEDLTTIQLNLNRVRGAGH
jgi:hypothetical protein